MQTEAAVDDDTRKGVEEHQLYRVDRKKIFAVPEAVIDQRCVEIASRSCSGSARNSSGTTSGRSGLVNPRHRSLRV